MYQRFSGIANPLITAAVGSAVVITGLLLLIYSDNSPSTRRAADVDELFVYCAAGVRPPLEAIAVNYQEEYGVRVRLQYGGSNTLVSQIEVARTGDLFVAADTSYIEMAREKGLVDERLPVAAVRPVILVAKGNPKGIQSIRDLVRSDVSVAIGNPEQAAIGKITRRLLSRAGLWEEFYQHVKETGVEKPTVPEVANDVLLGSVDAAIIWDSVAKQYDELDVVHTAELDQGASQITLGVLSFAEDSTAALRFARYVAACDRGLTVFKSLGFEIVDGDEWAVTPELTFFAGSVNRRALEPVIESFQEREGVHINTVYNGCGILTAQMQSMLEKDQVSGFPDMYMACDTYYLDTVADLFQDAVNVSTTDIVIVVQKGNPKGIAGVQDLAKPGIRVALGQPDQCTIGVLSRRLLESQGIYEELLRENVVTQTATSALLVPSITTGSADAVLAYATDTFAERDKLDVVEIGSPLAKAVQPYGIARSSGHKYLGRRLFETISSSRKSFEEAGFTWRLAEGEVVFSTGSIASTEDKAP